ncbi:MAG: glycoside hydrolase family 43 protein [Bacillota bacterium]
MGKSKKSSIIILLMLIAAVLSCCGLWRADGMEEKELKLLSDKDVGDRFYQNPVGNIFNIGDPFVLKASDGKYYCYPTSWNMGFKAWESADMVNWYDIGPVYKGYTSWGTLDFWAPEVVEYNGRYYMYYTARWKENKSLRIGVAVSDSPKGPFKDVYDHPMFDFGYAVIDANILIDEDGKKFMYYSRDCSENIVDGKHESHIYGIELNDDMISVKGEPVLLTRPDQGWEKYSGNDWRWNEGPTVFKRNGKYYLMYSANFYASKMYSIGYATSDSPLGKYEKYENNPILESEITWKHVSGPGHNSIAASPDGSELFIVYHTHTNPKEGGGNRQIFIDRMGFRKDGSIYVNGPSVTQQLMPSGAMEYTNIAKTSVITTSSEKEGFKKDFLIDGEIGIYAKFGENQWVGTTDKGSVWIKMEWDKNQKMSGVLIYNSALINTKLNSCKLVFSNGYVVSKLDFPQEPGAAATACFEEMEVKWVRIELGASGDSREIGLSEIVVIGKKQ